MAAEIHPLAHVAADVELDEGVVIGPFAVVEKGVRIGARSRIDMHAIVRTGTRLGAGNVVHPFAVLGGSPQDRRYDDEPTELAIGDRNVFREHVTVHRGTAQGGGITQIGSDGLFMAGAHVAHDCIVGDRVTLANGTLLGGHVKLAENVVTGGLVAIAPFVRVARSAFLAGGAMVERNVPPFVIAAGDRARVRALNRVGLERAGVPEPSRRALEGAFGALFRGQLALRVAAQALADDADPYVRELVAFVLSEA